MNKAFINEDKNTIENIELFEELLNVSWKQVFLYIYRLMKKKLKKI